MQILKILLIFSLSLNLYAASSQMLPISPSEKQLNDDLKEILEAAKFEEGFISFTRSRALENTIEFKCANSQMILDIKATDQEWGASLYYGLQKLGFLFPHPRISLYPKRDKVLKMCGKTASFKPAFKYRGFHLHTLHPSEWIHGFQMGETQIALDLIKWLARNSQNTFDISLLRDDDENIFKNLKKPFRYAKKFGIYPGIALGMSLHQQNSYKILDLFTSLTGLGAQDKIKEKIQKLIKNIDFSFLNLESGTSEFTSVSYEDNISWMNTVSDLLKKHQRQLFTKVHVSTNQFSEKYGNFNFLPQYAKASVGILPHTVMFYDLYEAQAPMYGNKNFHHMRDFLLKEKDKRPTWYYPETSYYILMDIDIPLLLTDYLVSRTRDMKNLAQDKIEGHFNFTTGHELGYWLFDWTIALNNNLDYEFDPMIGLKLLDESEDVWAKILKFQTYYFKEKQLIQELSFPNMQDEISKSHRIHQRTNLDEYQEDPKALKVVIEKLLEAKNNIPSTELVNNRELKMLLDITHLRIEHALHTRMAIRHPQDSELRLNQINQARLIRSKAQEIMNEYLKQFNRYPKASIFERNKNLTSYQFGYGFTASNLHLWHREEEQVLQENWFPLFMQIMDVWDILF